VLEILRYEAKKLTHGKIEYELKIILKRFDGRFKKFKI
jgi:hypothetical protein